MVMGVRHMPQMDVLDIAAGPHSETVSAFAVADAPQCPVCGERAYQVTEADYAGFDPLNPGYAYRLRCEACRERGLTVQGAGGQTELRAAENWISALKLTERARRGRPDPYARDDNGKIVQDEALIVEAGRTVELLAAAHLTLDRCLDAKASVRNGARRRFTELRARIDASIGRMDELKRRAEAGGAPHGGADPLPKKKRTRKETK
jgi:hypothetical protein